MLPILLDAPCNKHCDVCHPQPTPTNLLRTTIACITIFATMLFPLYKSYKALESGKLRPARAMLAFWSVTALINGLKGVVDETFGHYSNYILYQVVLLTVKLIPIIIGPDQIYASCIRPFFSAQEEEVDKVIRTAYHAKDKAQEEIVEPLKSNIMQKLPLKKNGYSTHEQSSGKETNSTDPSSSTFGEKESLNDFVMHQRQSGQCWKDLNQLNNESLMRRRRIPLSENEDSQYTNRSRQEVRSAEDIARNEALERERLQQDKRQMHVELREKITSVN